MLGLGDAAIASLTLPLLNAMSKDSREVSAIVPESSWTVRDGRSWSHPVRGGDAGLRRGGIIALDRADVDFRNGELVVRRSVYVRAKIRYESTPKGKKDKAHPEPDRECG